MITDNSGINSIALCKIYGKNMICTNINNTFKFISEIGSIVEFTTQNIHNEKVQPGGFLFVFIFNNKIAFDIVYGDIVDVEARNIEKLDIQFVNI